MAKGTAAASSKRRKRLTEGFPVRTEAGEILVRAKQLQSNEAARKRKMSKDKTLTSDRDAMQIQDRQSMEQRAGLRRGSR